MSRRPAVPPVDHGRDREHWRGLLTATHRAVEALPAAPSEDLAKAALRGRDLWTPPAAYPCSLIAGAFVGLVVAFVRQRDPDRRARIAKVLIECGALLDELIEAALDAVMPVEPADRPVRLPYRDA